MAGRGHGWSMAKWQQRQAEEQRFVDDPPASCTFRLYRFQGPQLTQFQSHFPEVTASVTSVLMLANIARDQLPLSRLMVTRCGPRFQVFFCEGVRMASLERPKRSAPPISRFQDVVFEPPPAAVSAAPRTRCAPEITRPASPSAAAPHNSLPDARIRTPRPRNPSAAAPWHLKSAVSNPFYRTASFGGNNTSPPLRRYMVCVPVAAASGRRPSGSR